MSFGWSVLGACSTDNNQLSVIPCGDAKLNGRPTILILGQHKCTFYTDIIIDHLMVI